MNVSKCLLFSLLFKPVSGLILPLTKPNGDPDIKSLISHVTLLEQSMEQKMSALEADAKTSNAELTTVKGLLQKTEDELAAVRADLSSAEADIAVLKHDLQKSPDPVEFAMLKSEVEVLRRNLGTSLQHLNSSVLDSVTTDVKSNVAEITSIKSQLHSIQTDVHATVGDLNTSNEAIRNFTSQMKGIYQKVDSIAQINMVKITNLTEEVKEIKQSVNVTTKVDLNALEVKVKKLSGDMVTLRQHAMKNTTGTNVAFRVIQYGTYYNGSSTLKFDTVDYNAGGGYNNMTGTFTAPVTGTYILYAVVKLYHNYANYKIYIHNGQKVIGKGSCKLQDEKNPYDVRIATIVVIAHLDMWDKIYVTADDDAAKGWIIGEGETSYGGVLINTV